MYLNVCANVCRLHEQCLGSDGKEKEKEDSHKKEEHSDAGNIKMFRTNSYCERYKRTNRAADLRRCKRQDCTQTLTSIGCKYMSEEGFCYRRNGQRFCRDNEENEMCFTRDKVKDPKRTECPKREVELRINSQCDRYTLRKRPRYLKRCTLQDCRQTQTNVGCKFVNKDGFCYTPAGQTYCAENGPSDPEKIENDDGENAVGDPRCLTEVSDPLRPVCKVDKHVAESKLPSPNDVGLAEGLRVNFYYIGEPMEHMPNVRRRVPNFVTTADEIHFQDEASFKALDPSKPDDLWAVVIDGVIAVEEAGEHEFFMNSDDGSHLWIDGRMIIDNGGMHNADEQKTASFNLDQGYHSIKIDMFDGAHDAVLNVLWSGPTTEAKKDYVNGYYFTSSEPGSDSKNPLPSPEKMGLTKGFLMSVYSSNLPNPMDSVPHLDSMKPDFTARNDIIDFPNVNAHGPINQLKFVHKCNIDRAKDVLGKFYSLGRSSA